MTIPVEMHGSQITEVPPVAETSAINARMLHLSPSRNGGGGGGCYEQLCAPAVLGEVLKSCN